MVEDWLIDVEAGVVQFFRVRWAVVQNYKMFGCSEMEEMYAFEWEFVSLDIVVALG